MTVDPYGSPPTPPLNAPPAQGPQVGVQPGTSGLVMASLIIVVGPSGSQLVIGPNVPQTVINFYNSHGQAVNKMWIGEYFDANNYRYTVWGTLSAGTQQFHAEGWVRAGTLSEVLAEYFDTTNNVVDSTHGSNARDTEESWYGGRIRLRNDITTGVTTDLTFQNAAGTDLSAERGLQVARNLTGNPILTVGAGGENRIVSLPASTYRADRIYQFMYRCVATPAVADTIATVRLRKGTLVTDPIVMAWQFLLRNTGARQECLCYGLFAVAAGADVAATLSIWGLSNATGATSYYANGSGQGEIWISDMGSTTQANVTAVNAYPTL